MTSTVKVLLVVGVLALTASVANARMGASYTVAGTQGITLAATDAPAAAPAPAATPAPAHHPKPVVAHVLTAKEIQASIDRENAKHEKEMKRLQALLDKETKANSKDGIARVQKLIDAENKRHEKVIADLQKKLDALTPPPAPANP